MSEGLISDILEIADSLQIGSLLTAIDVEKTFDSVNYFFLISVLKRHSFGDDSIKWIIIFLKPQTVCLKRREGTCHFKPERVAWQGDAISAYVSILALEKAFTLINK